MLRLECIVSFIIYGICAIFSFIRWGFSTSGALALPNLRLDCADYLPQEAFLMCEAFTETIFKENHPLKLESTAVHLNVAVRLCFHAARLAACGWPIPPSQS